MNIQPILLFFLKNSIYIKHCKYYALNLIYTHTQVYFRLNITNIRIIMTELSSQDIKILELLQTNADRSSSEIAERLNMSQSPCWRRINRLEQDNVIEKKVAILNREALGMDLVAFTTINLSKVSQKNMQIFEKAITKLDEVVECYTMTGAWDYMLKIVVRDIRHYEIFVRNQLLSNVPNIGEIHSHMAVTEIKNTTELPLQQQL